MARGDKLFLSKMIPHWIKINRYMLQLKMHIIDKDIPWLNQKQRKLKIKKLNLIVINVLRFLICGPRTKGGPVKRVFWKYSSTLHVFSINSLCFVSTLSVRRIITNSIIWSGGPINWSPWITLRGGRIPRDTGNHPSLPSRPVSSRPSLKS